MGGFLDGRPLAVAHRGGAAEAPENSHAAFARAVALGYEVLETDVHVTADGVAVALHDATLDRVTDRTGRVRNLPWAEVRRARIAGTEPVPRLDELLGTWPHVRWMLDAKHATSVVPLVDVVRRLRLTERVCVGAFSDARVSHLRAALPGAASALGPREVARLALAARTGLGRAALRRMVPPSAAVVPARVGRAALVDTRFVSAARAAGLGVVVWTVNERAEMTRLLDAGVDGLVSDELLLLREVLTTRGCWTGRYG